MIDEEHFINYNVASDIFRYHVSKKGCEMKTFLKKYGHAWVFIYALIYMPWFVWLEKTVTVNYHVIHIPLDDKIPFCEYFIIPYYLWFLLVPAVFAYEFFYSKREFYRMCILMFSGMTVFLIVCTVWHNGVDLRSQVHLSDNLCSELVRHLHEADTCTNVLPSMHVFNTLGCLIALFESRGIKKKRGLILGASTLLCVFILMSTVFLKQHSFVDVAAAVVLAVILYAIVYLPYHFYPESDSELSAN